MYKSKDVLLYSGGGSFKIHFPVGQSGLRDRKVDVLVPENILVYLRQLTIHGVDDEIRLLSTHRHHRSSDAKHTAL